MPNTDDQFDEKDIVFRYSRERRLERASETVKKINEEGKKFSFSLFRPLTATKPLSFLFASIVVLVAVMLLFSYLFGSKKETVFGGNSISVSAFTFEGKTYLTLNKKIHDKNNFYTGTVDLAVSPENASQGDASPGDASQGGKPPGDTSPEIIIENERIFFTSEDEEIFKMALPFEAERLLILIQGEKEMQRLQVITE